MLTVEERLARVEVTCKNLEKHLNHLHDKMDSLLKEQQKIIKYVVVGLLSILATVVGVNLVPP